MSPTSTLTHQRFTRYAFVAVAGAAAVSLAACGSSNTHSNATSSAQPSSSAAAPSSAGGAPDQHRGGHGEHGGKDHVAGLVGSVSGNTIQVTKKDGNATVDFDQSTKIAEGSPAQLTDVTAGSCIAVFPAGDDDNAATVTARRVLVSAARNGECPGAEPKERSGSESPTPPSGHQHENRGVRGTVASVSGNTIVVNRAEPDGSATTATNVTVNNETKYSKRAVVDASAIAAGKCLFAIGTNDASGTLQATMINLRAADNGTCGEHEHHK